MKSAKNNFVFCYPKPTNEVVMWGEREKLALQVYHYSGFTDRHLVYILDGKVVFNHFEYVLLTNNNSQYQADIFCCQSSKKK